MEGKSETAKKAPPAGTAKTCQDTGAGGYTNRRPTTPYGVFASFVVNRKEKKR